MKIFLCLLAITASAIAIGTTLIVIEIGSGSGIVRMLLNKPNKTATQ